MIFFVPVLVKVRGSFKPKTPPSIDLPNPPTASATSPARHPTVEYGLEGFISLLAIGVLATSSKYDTG